MDNLLDCTAAVVYMNNLVQDTNSSQDIRDLETRLVYHMWVALEKKDNMSNKLVFVTN